MMHTNTFGAGSPIVTTMTFTLAAGESVRHATLILTRQHHHGESTTGRARAIVLEAANGEIRVPPVIAGATAAEPRVRYEADFAGVVPASICGGSYGPAYCVFSYASGASTVFEIDADQRFRIEIADDKNVFDPGPSIIAFA